MKNLVVTLLLATAANADNLIRYDSGFSVNGRYVTTSNGSFYWSGGSAIKIGDYWVGDGWRTFPGGQGALTSIMLASPQDDLYAVPNSYDPIRYQPSIYEAQPIYPSAGTIESGIYFPGNVYHDQNPQWGSIPQPIYSEPPILLEPRGMPVYEPQQAEHADQDTTPIPGYDQFGLPLPPAQTPVVVTNVYVVLPGENAAPQPLGLLPSTPEVSNEIQASIAQARANQAQIANNPSQTNSDYGLQNEGLKGLTLGSVNGKPAISYIDESGKKQVMRVTIPQWIAIKESQNNNEGLEDLTLGSVHGQPAISYIDESGQKQVMRVTMPELLAIKEAKSKVKNDQIKAKKKSTVLSQDSHSQQIANTKVGRKSEESKSANAPQNIELTSEEWEKAFKDAFEEHMAERSLNAWIEYAKSSGVEK